MMTDLHFLRPWWFLALIPWLLVISTLWRQKPSFGAWAEICDSQLLDHMLQTKNAVKRSRPLLFLFFSGLFVILGCSGPSWSKLPVPTYKPIEPRVLVLDMSENMLAKDLSPDRLSRAKFELHDLLANKGVGQFGLVVFTGEPFVVSPLTDDGKTISSLLPVLTPGIMPVGGQNLERALVEASQLINNAGYEFGQILVLTADSPSAQAIARAKLLAEKGIFSSIMPVTADKKINPLYLQFAHAGDGQVIQFTANSKDIQQWLNQNTREKALSLSQQDQIPTWRDEGRWFFIPALFGLLPVFRRGWLQRVFA